MSGAALSAVVVAVVLAAAMAALAVAVRRRPGGVPEPGRPDAVSDDVVTGLMTELRKWQAETAYWKTQAERLQRELDARD